MPGLRGRSPPRRCPTPRSRRPTQLRSTSSNTCCFMLLKIIPMPLSIGGHRGDAASAAVASIRLMPWPGSRRRSGPRLRADAEERWWRRTRHRRSTAATPPPGSASTWRSLAHPIRSEGTASRRTHRARTRADQDATGCCAGERRITSGPPRSRRRRWAPGIGPQSTWLNTCRSSLLRRPLRQGCSSREEAAVASTGRGVF